MDVRRQRPRSAATGCDIWWLVPPPETTPFAIHYLVREIFARQVTHLDFHRRGSLSRVAIIDDVAKAAAATAIAPDSCTVILRSWSIIACMQNKQEFRQDLSSLNAWMPISQPLDQKSLVVVE